MAYKTADALGDLGTVSTPEEASELLADPAYHRAVLAGLQTHSQSQYYSQSLYAQIESDMILVGFCGIKDPARPVSS
jgi:magnesium-transporting ATPase (P-type)